MRNVHDKQKIKDQCRARTAFFALFIISLFLVPILADAQSWPSEPTISYDETGQPVAAQRDLDYALWSIKARTGMSAEVVASAGQIRILWRSNLQIAAICGMPCDGYAAWNWDGAGNMTDSTVYLNSEAYKDGGPRLTRTMIHEIAHALYGNIHHSEPGAVLKAEGYYPHDYALTTGDVLAMPSHGRSMCHAELTLQNDVYIPDIEGQKAMLRYQGNGVWALASLAENQSTQGCTQASVTDKMEIEIQDLRGLYGAYTYVRLEPIGNDLWKLGYAE